ncbi:hypothetical protein [Sphaerospermopsis sp. FACHB-1194]|uniref:hypothetical protein n=1 Tax=Sphaerospermopsis sp. FACHB-1194 TaxID=2692862 RepID=UPI0016805335|nr:hypothetical protein [Sphaerospermopsis sp. FACHB-1194]MBD2147813.1 hypothetical protein [Sphaerospermopsis sp. FACHB-1194]
MLRKSFHEGIGVRSQESGVRRKFENSFSISRNPKKCTLFHVYPSKPLHFFPIYQPQTFDLSAFCIFSANPNY